MKLTLPPSAARRRGSMPPAGNSGLALPSSGTGPAQYAAKAPSPLAASTSGPYLKTLSPNDAPSVLLAPSTLILDIRPPSAFDTIHLVFAHSVSVPSTLLRRPAFSLAKMAAMLAPPSQEAVNKWQETQNVVLVDADSLSAGEGSIMEGLAGKFEREGYKGTVWYVRGGQAALMGVPEVKSKMVGEDEGAEGLRPSSAMAFSLGGSAKSSRAPSFRSEKQSHKPSAPMVGTPAVKPRSNPFDKSRDGSETERPLSLRGLNFSDSASQVSGSSASSAAKSGSGGSGSRSGTGSGSSARHSRPGGSRQAANPFFDNIRQNLELSHGGITERIALQLPSEARRRAHELPTWMSELVMLSDKAAADRLAHQFYSVELNEQKRLQAIMDYHSRASGAMLQATKIGDSVGGGMQWRDQRDKDKEEVERLEGWAQGMWHEKGEEYYPFSITAGIERGAKNRYKNIWPYDFSRVRLNAPADDESDYINASHVQPRGTSRRYIATQGPLDATYRDFWTLIWEQDVRVIVMLTKQYEGGMIKCGNYWQDENYGPLHVILDSQTGGEDAAHPSQVSGFDFGMTAASAPPKASESAADNEAVNIRRDFILTNDNDSAAGSRRIVQIQCVNWPDFDVPESPDVLLGVIRDVDQAVDEVVPAQQRGQGGADRCEQSPVLVHCSAGVGRTGSFIVVDSIIDALHREYNSSAAAGTEDDRAGSTSKMSIAASTATSNKDRSDSLESQNSGSSGRSSKSVSFSVPPPLKSANALSGSAIATPSPTTTPPPADPIQAPSPRRFARPQSTAARLGSHAEAEEEARHNAGAAEEGGMDVDQPSEPMSAPSRKSYAGAGAPSPGKSRYQTSSKAPDPWSYRDNEGSVGDDQSETSSNAGGGESIGRRPSLVSLGGSDRNSQEQLHTIIENPAPVTKSSDRHRTPSPLQAMDNPVLDVLQGMRVQRMSLVQSLRQFVFVHRAIVAYYLGLIDDPAEQDRKGSKESSAETNDPRSSSLPPNSSSATDSHTTIATVDSNTTSGSYSTAPTSISEGSEDEGHHKRRASPTELSPERPAPGLPVGETGERAARPHASTLQRRGSNKRIKKGLEDDFKMSPSPGPGPGVGSSSAGTGTGSESNAGSSVFGSSV